MRALSFAIFAAVLGIGMTVTAPKAEAQVSVQIGPAPVCPYGYYATAPYDCAPYGYYGPDWFVNGGFIGAGPWFHGPEHFYGHVDGRFDRDHYRGPFPHRGEHSTHSVEHMDHFRGRDMRDGHGHAQEHSDHDRH